MTGTGNLGWARVRPPGAHLLRRGAWYPVVNSNGRGLVILNVGHRNIPVLRAALEIRRSRSDHFSVVMRRPGDPNPARGTPGDLGLTYAVCPCSSARVRLAGQPLQLVCPRCGNEHLVEWGESC